jgi:hypothetical protein
MEGRAEMEIMVEAPNSIATTVKRSKRAKPSIKVRDAITANEESNVLLEGKLEQQCDHWA